MTMRAQIIQTNSASFARVAIDPVTLDIIENALRNARIEMDATLVRTAMSPGIREQGDAFPADRRPQGPDDRRPVRQLYRPVSSTVLTAQSKTGDMIFLSDPVFGRRRDQPFERLAGSAAGVQGRASDRLYLDVRPHVRHRRQSGRIDADQCHHSIFQEGVRIPPVKIWKTGRL